MRTIFQVTDPVGSNVLLTTAEGKAALGITDSSRDADIDRLIARISASIFRATKVRTDGVNPPTLLAEELKDTFRLECEQNWLLLSRRRVSEITVTVGETELTADTDYTLDAASGELFRLSGDARICWPSGTTVVEYTAGFTTAPEDLKLAAELWLRSLWRTDYGEPAQISDPFTKVEDIPGVRRLERWLPQMTNNTMPSTIPPEVETILYEGGYIETWVA